VLVAGCAAPAPEAGLHGFETVGIVVDGQRLDVSLAETSTQRNQGLRGVKELPKEIDGMLFSWRDATPTTFGMRDTIIPLDIWWFDDEGRLLGSTDMDPCLEEPCLSYASPGPVLWALETPLDAFDFSPGSSLTTVETG